jgi:hypothetical protein
VDGGALGGRRTNLRGAVLAGRRHNATIVALRTDFGRLGVRDLQKQLADRSRHWDEADGGRDAARFRALVRLRNALAHGNQKQVEELRRQGHLDTVGWAREQQPVLDRLTRTMDRILWEPLTERTGEEPW